MKKNIYIAGAEYGSGKSVIALAVMEMLTGYSPNVGFFRPIIAEPDNNNPIIELMRTRYQLTYANELFYGCTLSEAKRLLKSNQYDKLLKTILDKFKKLEEHCDHILCLGTDYKVSSTFEFDFNADVANNLGCLIIPVVRGIDRDTAELVQASATFLRSLSERKCDIAAIVINRVNKMDRVVAKDVHRQLKTNDVPVFVVPEVPSLAQPTMADITKALNARIIYGDEDSQHLEITNYKVAAMQLPDFLNYVESGSLIITPGDRSDIVLGTLMAHPSKTYPRVSGILLTGGIDLAQQVKTLLEGFEKIPMSILSVDTDTYTTAMNVHEVSAMLNVSDQRKIAAALGVVETNIDLVRLEQVIASKESKRVTPLMFEFELIRRARSDKKHIVLPEGEEERILRAAEILIARDVVSLTLLGDEAVIRKRITELGLHIEDIAIVDPHSSPWCDEFANVYFELRKHKGISTEMAKDIMTDVSYFGTMMVHLGYADGMVSGSVHTTQHTIRPSFEIIKTKPGAKLVSSVFFMCLEDRVLVYGDCAINPNPNAEQLADIAIASAQTARSFGIEPKVALLSYSTGSSGKGDDVNHVIEATRIAKELRPDLALEGPLQYDAAIDKKVAKTKLPNNKVAGHATVFIFPDLNTGNNTYKAVQRSSGAVAVGPVLQGLNKPVNDLSRGCTVTDIVNTVAITAIQSQTG